MGDFFISSQAVVNLIVYFTYTVQCMYEVLYQTPNELPSKILCCSRPPPPPAKSLYATHDSIVIYRGIEIWKMYMHMPSYMGQSWTSNKLLGISMVSMFNKMNIQLGDTQSYHIPCNQTERGNRVYNSVLSDIYETCNMTTSCCIFHLFKIK